jgi:ATP-dependent Clp protease ATP-binding subunit ClpA
MAKIPSPGTGTRSGPDLPYTSGTKKVLEEAMAQARALDHGYLGSAHLLLGMLREGQGIAGQVLLEAGTDLPTLTAEVTRVVGTELGQQDRTTAPSLGTRYIPYRHSDTVFPAAGLVALGISLLALLVAVLALVIAFRR